MRWWRPDSLRGRVLRDIGIGLLLASAILGGAMVALQRAGSEALVHNGLEGQAGDIAEQLSLHDDGMRLALHDRMQWGYDAFYRHLKYRVLDARGEVVLSSESDTRPLARDGEDVRLVRDRFTAMRDGLALQAVTVPVDIDGQRYWIQAARSDRFLQLAEEAIVPVVRETTVMACGIALLSFAVFAGFGLHRALAPVRAASREAMRIGPGDPSARLSTQAMPAEIRPLAVAVNAGLARLEAGLRAQQRFLADAAHELKTPLTVLRGRMELDAPPALRASAVGELDGMARIVGQLLLLAEAADPNGYRMAPVDLVRVVATAEAMVAFIAERRAVRVVVDVRDRRTIVQGDEAALVAAVRNVLENAIRHSPPGGRVEIVIDANAIGVRDEGEGLAPGVEAQVFERFWRADRNGEGAGLGLSIVRDVMRAHGGEAFASNRRDRGGAEFRLAFQPR